MKCKFIGILLLLIISQVSCKDTENKEFESLELSQNLNENNQSLDYSPINLDSANLNINVSRHNAITVAVAKVSPAVVGINVTEVKTIEYRNPFFDDPLFQRFFGRDFGVQRRKYEVRGLGSGFLISPDGYILTNHHVAGDATKIVVTLTDGTKHDAKIIGSDRTSDVALLKIEGENFPYIKFANSDNVIIGEWVIALGNPFGLFDMNSKPTVTVGVVSNKGVDIFNDGRVYKGMIQTDAAISSGNSGGPLVNALGEVVGVNTIIFSTAKDYQGAGSIGIGFAIPINRIKKIIKKLMEKRKIDRNFDTGLEVREIDATIAKYLDSDIDEGVVIFSITRNSPAEKAGLEPGDVILKINEIPVKRLEDFYIELYDNEAGDKVKLEVLRSNKKLTKILYLEPK